MKLSLFNMGFFVQVQSLKKQNLKFNSKEFLILNSQHSY